MCSVNTTNIRKLMFLPQHVSTPERHHQAEYLRTIQPDDDYVQHYKGYVINGS